MTPPTPQTPSSVSTTTKVELRLPGPAETRSVSTLVIFMAPPRVREGSSSNLTGQVVK